MERARIISSEALAALCLQMQALTAAGISPEECFSILSEDAQDAAERALYRSLTAALEEGASLSDALSASGRFPDYMTGMVRVGERTGALESVLGALAGHFDREARLRQSVRSAVQFPLLMAVLMFALLAVLLVFVLPVFRGAFASAGLSLSATSAGLLAAGRWIVWAAGALLLLAVLLGALLWYDWKTAGLGLLRRMRLFRRAAAGRFASVMALMLHSGLPLEESLRRAGELAGCEQADDAADRIEDGGRLSDALGQTGLFSGFFLRMLRVGEHTGRTEQMMNEVAARMNEQVSDEIDEQIARIEPAIVAVLAVCAGLALLSVLLPLLGAAASFG
ncbi:MAG: type II secretion system F family protein [Eubacteriales bacterium]|nr:type II secretion system F family protein [Eubacteriales bacterium]